MTAHPITLDELARRSRIAATASAERDTAIVELALAGTARADLCAASGLSDDQVRRIERKGGVPARKRGPRGRNTNAAQ